MRPVIRCRPAPTPIAHLPPAPPRSAPAALPAQPLSWHQVPHPSAVRGQLRRKPKVIKLPRLTASAFGRPRLMPARLAPCPPASSCWRPVPAARCRRSSTRATPPTFPARVVAVGTDRPGPLAQSPCGSRRHPDVDGAAVRSPRPAGVRRGRGRADRRSRARSRRARRLHEGARAGRGQPLSHREHPPVAAAGLPRRPCDPRRARIRRQGRPAAPCTRWTRASTPGRSSPRPPSRSSTGDDEDSLRARIQATERVLYVQTIRELCSEISSKLNEVLS